MQSTLTDYAEQPTEPGSFVLQNSRMLKVDLAGAGGHFFAKQGSMVAYQGDVDFGFQGREASPSCSRRRSRARACR